MARITIEDCLKKVPSRFELVHLAAQRVRQIREGSEYLVSSPKNEDIVVALREIAAGKITQENIEASQEVLFANSEDFSADEDFEDEPENEQEDDQETDDLPDDEDDEEGQEDEDANEDNDDSDDDDEEEDE